MDTPIDRRTFVGATVAGIALLAGASPQWSAARQESGATPATDPISDLGLPTLSVTATASGMTVDQASIPAGRYAVSLDNQLDVEAYAAFMILPDGIVADDLNDALAAAIAEEAPPPDWYYSATSAGGVGAMPGGRVSFVIDLAPGEYVVHPDGPIPGVTVTSLSVTGEMPDDLPDIPSDVTIEMREMAFAIDGELAAGTQVVTFINAGTVSHFTDIYAVPEGTTIDDFHAMVAAFAGGPAATPVDGGLAFDDLVPVVAMSIQSAGATVWTEVTFEAGTLLLVCWVFNPETGTAHAMEGMVEIVVIS